jgi:hypothetical protein
LHASLHYTPTKGTSELVSKAQIGVSITSAPVTVELLGPENIVSGDLMEYIIDYKNQDNRPLQDAQIKITYPEGFEFASSEPFPSENKNVWYIGTVEPNVGGKIRIKGKMNGTEGQIKNTKVMIGHAGSSGDFAVYNQRERKTKIVAPALVIAQDVAGNPNKIVHAGETISYIIAYKNNSDLTLRDAIVTVSINGSVLDFSRLVLEKGSFDEKNGIITWKSSDAPGLGSIPPKGQGSIGFSIGVKSNIPINSPADKNLIISSSAKIDSPDIPTPIGANKVIGSNQLDLMLGTKVIFEQLGYFNDTQLPNTGPIPMEVGKETSFTLHWSITNVSNDISGGTVTSTLPSGVKWLGKIFPSNEKISYNERSNQLSWDTGPIAAATGILTPKKEVAFQISVIPQINEAGKKITLINETSFSTKDLFTGENINFSLKAKDTLLSEDSKMPGNSYEVIQ